MSTVLAMPQSTSAAAFARIDSPGNWTSAQIGGAEGLTHRLSAEQASGMAALAKALDGREVGSITAADLADPQLVALMKAVKFELSRGKGAVLLSGLDLAGISEAQFSRLFWALGTHLGEGAVQSSKRDLIGRVEKRADNPEQRGYQLDIELAPHCDFHEYLALGCYRVADEGGESGMVSALAIHDEIARTRPDLLAALYRGFPHQSATPDDRSDHDVPVYAKQDGVISCYYHKLFFVNAARDTGRPIPADLSEALDLMATLSRREDLRASFLMQPGEMIFWHNFVNFHSRESFTDRPEHRRLLFRLWLHANPGEGRPMPADFIDRARLIDRIHDAGQPGIIYKLDQLR